MFARKKVTKVAGERNSISRCGDGSDGSRIEFDFMGAADSKQRLSDYHLYLTLAFAVRDDHSGRSDEFKMLLNEVSVFVKTASARDLRERGKKLEQLLTKVADLHNNLLPRKKGVHEIARDFSVLLIEEPNVWRYGILKGWLLECFDLSRLPETEDLPLHARIGIGVHSGRVSVEEIALLTDAFFLFVRARESLQRMTDVANHIDQSRFTHEHYRKITALNAAVCTFSRLGVLTAVAFVETFVNSVGWNEAVQRSDITERDRSELKGMRKDRYLSLVAKLERFPRIIRADKGTPIILSDEKQQREPFISFLRETKGIRDASMHYAPGKADITLPPQEWLQLLENALSHAVAVARKFWSACYPHRDQPRYLAQLYYQGLLQHALDRLADADSEITLA